MAESPMVGARTGKNALSAIASASGRKEAEAVRLLNSPLNR